MAIITLVTDFGIVDEYVGVMKGVILSINPAAAIVDITHHIHPQDIIHAAYLVESASKYFPDGTIHLVVVDPGVGSERSIIAVKRSGHVFIAPDNGVLSLLMDKETIDAIFRIENPHYFLKDISRTFHGRDIFAPVAGHLSLGVDLKNFGIPIYKGELVRLAVEKPQVSSQGELIGTIIAADRFGNLVTNIDVDSIRSFCTVSSYSALEIRIGKNNIIGISNSYNSVGAEKPLTIIGSRGYLEIAVNCGNAAHHFEAKRGEKVRLFLPKL